MKVNLSEEQKAAIINEIQQLFEFSNDGITELNAEKVFSIFSSKEDAKYVRNGHLYPSIETAKNQFAEWFSKPNAVKQIITYDPIIYDIIDENTVLMTTIGTFRRKDIVIPEQNPWVVGYTLLWTKEEEGWKVFNMHNSWE
ncbi:MAG: hypothetical protein HQ521_11370 [Bacteroidetes bacterium]|nr:hypothetical protein [Bacteroidota bacterium]